MGRKVEQAEHGRMTDGGRVHAFEDDALGDRDAVGLAQAIAAREVSAREVVDAAIQSRASCASYMSASAK